ncbi:hypothetical protein N665_0004s0068 [Sinapis alba]|nr:hypothetical protein N665_0004s0068 [Sinapis alba]
MTNVYLLLKVLFIILSVIAVHHLPVATSKQWCIANSTATEAELRLDIYLGCEHKFVDCRPIYDGGSCFVPDTLISHASFVMNAFFQLHNRTKHYCGYNSTGIITSTDPSYGSCVYYAP